MYKILTLHKRTVVLRILIWHQRKDCAFDTLKNLTVFGNVRRIQSNLNKLALNLRVSNHFLIFLSTNYFKFTWNICFYHLFAIAVFILFNCNRSYKCKNALYLIHYTCSSFTGYFFRNSQNANITYESLCAGFQLIVLI